MPRKKATTHNGYDWIAEELRPLAVPIGDVKADPENARGHSEENIVAIMASLKEFGQRQPVVVNKSTGVIAAGNGRHAAARRLGWTHIAALYVDESLARHRHFAIADNRTAELATWQQDQLAAQLLEMQDGAPDLYDALLLDQLGDGAEEVEAGGVAPEPQTDNADKLRAHWRVEAGQLWVIPGASGKHRLLCGDSTDAAQVQRLMQQDRAGLMNTDPPYGVSYANEKRPHPGVANDLLSNEKLQAFLESAFSSAASHALLPNAAWYMWHAHLTQGYFAAAAAAAANVVLHRQIIWVKPILLLGRGQYHWKHEPCFMGWVKGHQPPDYGEGNGERTQTTVWDVGGITQAERREFNHATPKPVALFRIPIVKHLNDGEIAYEPFAGSGPQFVAAELTRRICYGIEIEPKYVAVILQRLKDMGLTPKLDGRG